MTAYTLGDVARICGVSRRRLRYWKRAALVEPLRPLGTGRRGDQTAFDFRGLVSVRTIAELVDRGLPLRRIRQSVAAVRARIPECEALPSVRAWDDCGRVVVRHDGVLMEPDGQLVLEWSPDAGVESLAANRSGERARQIALFWFERGCGLDGDSETWEQAAEAYRHAVHADPSFADAHCNLGSVYFNQGRRALARECFERAVGLRPGHVEANLNLGTLSEEDGADEAALRHYRAALGADPLFADTHVSLALVYEKLELPRTARSHWRRYLMLDAKGAWSELARRRLRDQ